MNRTTHARIAAHTRWARVADRGDATRPGRTAFLARFELEVDPDGLLDPTDRTLRAESARRAYFTRLAAKRWAS